MAKKSKLDVWQKLSLIATFFNPLPTGLAFSYVFMKQKKYRKFGKKLFLANLIWLGVLVYWFYFS